MEIGASAGPTLAIEIGASAPGIESVGQRRCDRGILCGSAPVLGVVDRGFRFWGFLIEVEGVPLVIN
jgi:hypothetical protein